MFRGSNSSFSLGIDSPGGPDCLLVTGSPRVRDVVKTLGTLVLGQLIAQIGAKRNGGVPIDVVISRLPALCFRGVSQLVNATQDGGIDMTLKFRRLPRLRTSCKGMNVRGVVAAMNGIIDNSTQDGRALR